jgi:hypothetical protein
MDIEPRLDHVRDIELKYPPPLVNQVQAPRMIYLCAWTRTPS